MPVTPPKCKICGDSHFGPLCPKYHTGASKRITVIDPNKSKAADTKLLPPPPKKKAKKKKAKA